MDRVLHYMQLHGVGSSVDRRCVCVVTRYRNNFAYQLLVQNMISSFIY